MAREKKKTANDSRKSFHKKNKVGAFSLGHQLLAVWGLWGEAEVDEGLANK